MWHSFPPAIAPIPPIPTHPTHPTHYHVTGALDRGLVTVLYASQEGTAAELAERCGAALRRRAFAAEVAACDDFDMSSLPDRTVVIFIWSTTGDGEIPDNAKAFWRFLLRRDLPPSCLAGVSVAVFGLGDSGYTKFNAAARKLSTRLAQLGADSLCERALGAWHRWLLVIGCRAAARPYPRNPHTPSLTTRRAGDDQSRLGVQGDYDTWCVNELWPALDEASPPPPGA